MEQSRSTTDKAPDSESGELLSPAALALARFALTRKLNDEGTQSFRMESFRNAGLPEVDQAYTSLPYTKRSGFGRLLRDEVLVCLEEHGIEAEFIEHGNTRGKTYELAIPGSYEDDSKLDLVEDLLLRSDDEITQ